jgi:hypothetical protein
MKLLDGIRGNAAWNDIVRDTDTGAAVPSLQYSHSLQARERLLRCPWRDGQRAGDPFGRRIKLLDLRHLYDCQVVPVGEDPKRVGTKLPIANLLAMQLQVIRRSEPLRPAARMCLSHKLCKVFRLTTFES